MARVSEELKKKIAKAEKQAIKAVHTEEKRRRKKVRTEQEDKSATPITTWLEDKWGIQGFILFHENAHWITELRSLGDGSRLARPRGLTEQEWLMYQSGDYTVKENGIYEFARGSVERSGNVGTVGGEQTPTTKTHKRGKASRSKVGKRKSISRKKSTKVAGRKGKQGKDSGKVEKPQKKQRKSKEK
jgi:hypothetical protein